MQLLAHRGDWKRGGAGNSSEAITRAFAAGFGIETDVRTYQGRLVLSHDTADATATPWKAFVEIWERFPTCPVFLNIKEDGLLPLLQPYLNSWRDRTVVCFDMSLPELVRYCRVLPSSQLATRISEWETAPLVEYCDWIWCDGFLADPDLLRAYPDKKLAFVSPELHGRTPGPFREKLIPFAQTHAQSVLLCTDALDTGPTA